MTHLKRITRENRLQIRYEMSDGTYNILHVDEEMCIFIDLALGNVDLTENIHPGMVATNKYLGKVYHQHGMLALRMMVEDIAKKADSLPRDAWCPKCGFEAIKKLIGEGTDRAEWGYTCCGGDWCR